MEALVCQQPSWELQLALPDGLRQPLDSVDISIDIGMKASDVSNSTSTKGWANGFLIIGGLLMIPGVGVFFANGGGISISLVVGVLLLLVGGSLRERAAHQASRETELPPPPEYFEQGESTLASTDGIRKPLRRGEGRVLCSRCSSSRPIPSDSCSTCGLQVPIS